MFIYLDSPYRSFHLSFKIRFRLTLTTRAIKGVHQARSFMNHSKDFLQLFTINNALTKQFYLKLKNLLKNDYSMSITLKNSQCVHRCTVNQTFKRKRKIAGSW